MCVRIAGVGWGLGGHKPFYHLSGGGWLKKMSGETGGS